MAEEDGGSALKSGDNGDLKKENDMIVVESPLLTVNLENCGTLPTCIFAVSAKRWKKIGDLVSSAKTATVTNQFSDICSISYDFKAMYAKSRVIDQSPTQCVLAFVEKIEDSCFLEDLEEYFADSL